MNLSFSKIPNNGKTINFKKDISVPVDYNQLSGMFIVNYKPLDIYIKSNTGFKVLEEFKREFINLYERRDSLEDQYKNHFKQIVK